MTKEQKKVASDILRGLGRDEAPYENKYTRKGGRRVKYQLYRTTPVVVHSVEGSGGQSWRLWKYEMSEVKAIPVNPGAKIVL